MKKLGIFVMGLAVVAFTLTSCEKPKPFVPGVENGFYVVGEAAGLADLVAEGQMGPGYNEAQENAKRDGMYEKYVVLEAGKKFHFVKKEGQLTVNYGAQLSNDSLLTDFVPLFGYKGKLAENVEMEVTKTALYHIILDFDEDKALEAVGGPQIVIAEVKWGVSGGMNSWGWTECPIEVAAGAKTLTWSWKDQELAAAGEFKFKNGNAWKINLDDAEKVKANANLGLDCLQGGKNIAVADAGKYDVTLTFNLAGGDVANSFKYELVLTQKSELPTTMYIIGNDFGNWDWNSEAVVEMVPVHSHPGMFWAVRHFTTDTEFKFCATKAWNGDFTGLGTNEGFVTPGNNKVEAAGIYTVIVDLKGDKVTVAPTAIYGMGDAFGGWDGGKEENLFAVEEDVKLVQTTKADGNLRMYVAIEGIDWWQAEFNIFDGVITPRGDGGDQAAVPVTAGQKITLNISNGTGSIQ